MTAAPEFGPVVPLHLADVIYPPAHPRSGTGPVYAYAVRLDGEVLLVDTGIGPRHPDIDRSYRPSRRDIGDGLRQHGIDPGSVRTIINTHLHFDHCGNNSRFPGARLVVQRVEFEAAKATRYTVSEWVDFVGARYDLVDGDHEVAEGVRVLSTPGHTAGHQSVAVAGPEGLCVIAGQAAETARDFEAAAHTDAAVARLAALSPRLVYFSHDHAVWRPAS